MRTSYIPYFHLAMAMLIVGSSVVAGKMMIMELPVFLASGLRFALAVACLTPIMYFREGGFPRLRRRSVLILLAQAMLGSVLFTVFLLYGLKWTTPSSAGVLTSTTPAWMALLAWAVFRESLTPRMAVGVGLALLGVLAINIMGGDGDSGSRAGGNVLLGNGLVLAAVLCESLFLVLRKFIPEPISPLATSTLVSLFGLGLFLPLSVYEAVGTDFSTISLTGWGSVVYYGLVVTVLAYLFWFAGIVRASAAAAGVMTGIMPVSALFLSWLVLGERIDAAQLAGCAFVLLGIIAISGAPIPGMRFLNRRKVEVVNEIVREGAVTQEAGRPL